MTAPVLGSGVWPAWMVRVANAVRGGPDDGCLLIGSTLDSNWLELLAQIIEQVDAGDYTDEAAVLGDDRHVITLENRQQVADRRVMLDGLKVGHHGGTDRILETRWVGMQMHHQVRFVHDADHLLALHHRDLRHI